MENEQLKYVITIDGPDCTGKTTLWRKANEYNKNIQIRGIVSNIAYAIKFNRNVDELIELYNRNPINYVVYLLNPINDKKLEMIYNRIRSHIYSNDTIVKELKEASETWNDYGYFEQAINILQTEYKGKLEIKYVKDNALDIFTDVIKDYEIDDINNYINNDAIKVLKSTPDTFEKEAKTLSEFKYIVFIDTLNKTEVIKKLYDSLDEEHKRMFNFLLDTESIDEIDIYDALSEYTVDDLVDFLDYYELSVDVRITCDIDTTSTVYISLADAARDDDIVSAIYDNSSVMDDLYDAAKEDVYNSELDLDVERVC